MVILGCIVSHIAGVERTGKAYPLVQPKLRKSIMPATLHKLVYIFHNMKLMTPESTSDAVNFDDFAQGLVDPDDLERITSNELSITSIPRRFVPAEEEKERDEEGEEEEEEEEDGEEEDEEDGEEEDEEEDEEEEVQDVPQAQDDAQLARMLVPSGFLARTEVPHSNLTGADIGSYIFAKVTIRGSSTAWRWGKLVRFFDPQTGPRSYAERYNFDVLYHGLRGNVGQMIEPSLYNSEATVNAEVGSWFFIEAVK
jgi:hypothetical protein